MNKAKQIKFTVEVGGKTFTTTATVAEGAEYEPLFAKFNEDNSFLATYFQQKDRCTLSLSPLACSQVASDRLRQQRSIKKSGRRDSNSRQPAWKAETHKQPSPTPSIGLASRFTHLSPNMSSAGEKGYDNFCSLAAKNVRTFLPFSAFYHSLLSAQRQKRL